MIPSAITRATNSVYRLNYVRMARLSDIGIHPLQTVRNWAQRQISPELLKIEFEKFFSKADKPIIVEMYNKAVGLEKPMYLRIIQHPNLSKMIGENFENFLTPQNHFV